MSVSMKQAINAVRGMLDENGWKYTFDDEKNRFSLSFKSKSKLSSVDVRIGVRARANDENACLRIFSYGYVDQHADEDCMASVCEYLTRANYGLSIGNFELDHSDGEIRYNVSINSVDALPGADALDDLVTIPVSMFNRYGNGLLAVSMGMMSPKDAIEQAEQ